MAAKASVLFLRKTCEIPKFGLQSVCEFMIIHSRDAAAGRSPGGTERQTSTRALWLSGVYVNKTKQTKKRCKISKLNSLKQTTFYDITQKTNDFLTQFYLATESLKCFTPIFSWHDLTCERYSTLNQIVPVWVSQVKTHNLDRFISQYTDD